MANQPSKNLEALNTEQLSSVYSHRISSASGLESIDAELSQGDVAYVEQPDSPYRTSSWIDIDTQDVTVVFESRWAKDGSPIVKPADGADVGGIRVGTGSTSIEDVEIRNFGFHGNQSTMTSTVKRLHGAIFDNAAECALDNFFLTKTHPYHEHNTGGSGVTCTDASQAITLRNGLIDDIGDRGIQLAGSEHDITGNRIINGFDRSVSLDMDHPDGTSHVANDCKVIGNTCKDNSDGSGIGVSEGGAAGNLVADNHIAGNFRSAVKFAHSSATDNVARDNFIDHADSDLARALVWLGPECTADSNHIINQSTSTSTTEIFKSEGADAVVRDNFVKENQGIEIVDNASSGLRVIDNEFDASGAPAVVLPSSGVARGNKITGSGGDPCIKLSGDDGVAEGNDLDANTFHGVSLRASDCDVLNNRIENFGSGGGAAGIISLNDTSLGGVTIEGNTGKTSNSPRAWIVERTGSARLRNNTLLSSVTAYDFTQTGPVVAVGNDPAFGVHRGLSPSSGSVSVTFDGTYTSKPLLDVVCESEAIWSATYSTDANGNYTGVTLSFVDNAGNAVNPTTHVKERPEA